MVSLKKMAKRSFLSQAKSGLIGVNREAVAEGVCSGGTDGGKGCEDHRRGPGTGTWEPVWKQPSLLNFIPYRFQDGTWGRDVLGSCLSRR